MSKRKDSRYSSGRSPHWIKSKNPACAAVRRTVEYAIGAKWLELLKEIAPSVTRAAVLRDPTIAAGIGQFAAIQAVGPIGIELSVIGPPDADAIERAVAAFARRLNGGHSATIFLPILKMWQVSGTITRELHLFFEKSIKLPSHQHRLSLPLLRVPV